ncbi:ATP-binding protein [Hoeflea poritis]|uniref:histidine kinase n=1 Tax=Hoeflea poritis TaxID=2993659 RepID=A0ABT4VVA7_9HYPH|nr:ATP-binding protein [Hoeflea poritis]MDA4848130.1 ATP-binding protein [Hoeflea poritis]
MAAEKRQPRSLAARVLVIASAWAVIALFVIGILILTLYRNGTERGFRDLLRAQLYNVINSVSLDENGQLEGTPQLGDLRFSQPGSGWYWIVDIVGDRPPDKLASVSLGDRTLAIPGTDSAPFNERYERIYISQDSTGQEELVAETEVLLGDNGEIARFRVAGAMADLNADVSAFSRQLILFLVIFGVGSLLVNAIAILFGLRPLDRIRRSLEEIRAGKTESLEGSFPREIAPLTGEVNALIENNRRIIERARMQVGNLAHSLKTPIAVLLNESRSMEPDQARLVNEQATAMQNQVQHYLDRARIAAQQNSVLVRTDTQKTLQRLMRVMERLNPDTAFELMLPDDSPNLAMEQHDVEEILGNMLENASKWATGKVRVRIKATGEMTAAATSESRPMLAISVEDDGPGMEDDQLAEALKRGRRLDESKPGTGLGLSIIKEISEEYKGSVKLGRSDLGGLSVTVSLPVAVR